ncbi:MAG TPA: antibiotic biosynthesis monooxygenase [Burkholderiales bacterium]|nr:antibiotic biosynthesis monooxygenase [Burkholderiales bacterium]
MIVRIFWGRIDPRAWPAVEEIYLRLTAKSTPGLRARLVTQDLNDPESMYTITFWDDAESIQKWLESDDYKVALLGALRPFVLGSHSVSLSHARVEDVQGLIAMSHES